ncbi:DUF481 domain-containing protein [Gilvimarinus xylanilyticus]|uniref:DUF481 domain-containing protein n=1 Tax=Gilvimarinus xylanilyticus TaxID=2944139 RepID=A0A9X2I127_9GAMM|nr:DUF481 domain-containing protein [Gilvimarinus xylanilyticus]MCP8898385.1 DUF481 domain-containing protein [Gilvimarinus xylanilyticus]
MFKDRGIASLLPSGFIAGLSFAIVALASITVQAQAPGAKPQGRVWPAPPERLAGWDWLQLDSGEWIKGEIIGLYDKTLTFDSDHFKEQTLDWDSDVNRLLSARSMSVRLNTGETVYGPVVIDETHLIFSSPVAAQYPRANIVAMTVKGERELDLWRTELGLSGTLKGGNVDEKGYSADVDIARRTAMSRFSMNYRGSFDEISGVQTAESHRAGGRYDRFIGTSLYWTPIYTEYFRDRFQNIDLRATYGVFIGYYLADRPHLSWSVSGGPGYQYQEFTTAPEGQDLTQSTAAVLAESRLEWDVTDDITYELTYQPQFTNKETGRYKHYLETSLELDVTDKLSVNFIYSWDRTAEPQVDEEGVLPEKDDYSLSVGVSWNQ